MKKIIWKKVIGRYIDSLEAFVGPVNFASVFYDSTRTKGSELMYRCSLVLPEMPKNNLFNTEEAAVDFAEKEIKKWIRGIS